MIVKKVTKCLLLFLSFVIVVLLIINYSTNNKHYDFDYSSIANNSIIAHAFGGIDDKDYTNSLEAFEYSYSNGIKVFEVDFDLTKDNVLICSHDEDMWRNITNSSLDYTYDNFKKTLIYNKYTPMDYMDVINLLNKYDDIIIVTDTKYSDRKTVKKQFEQLVNYAERINSDVLKRIVPQIYSESMLEYVMDVYNFDSIVYTLYQVSGWTKENIVKYCNDSGVRFITVSQYDIEKDIIDEWSKNDINIALFTINDKDDANRFINDGISMIYSDYLKPVDIETK